MLARVPGLGMRSVHKIIQARKYRNLNWENLKAIGVALNRAKFFIICNSRIWERKEWTPDQIKAQIIKTSTGKFRKDYSTQLNLFEHAV